MSEKSLQQLFSKTKPGDAGVMGDPINHSLSPLMHNAAFSTWWGAFRDRDEPTPTYHKFHIPSAKLNEAFDLARQSKLRGFNLTIPHKVDGFKLVDEVDSFGKTIGAINTVAFENGKLKGYNTDGYGFRRTIENELGFEAKDKKVLVLGAGGTGRVIVYQAVQLGAHVHWWNRSAQKITDNVKSLGLSSSTVTAVQTKEDLVKACNECDLVVNATPVGLNPEDGLPVEGLKFRPGHSVFDVIYNRKTRFLQEAEAAGAKITHGLGMLVYQGARSFEIWTGAPAPKEVMMSALTQSINQGNN